MEVASVASVYYKGIKQQELSISAFEVHNNNITYGTLKTKRACMVLKSERIGFTIYVTFSSTTIINVGP